MTDDEKIEERLALVRQRVANEPHPRISDRAFLLSLLDETAEERRERTEAAVRRMHGLDQP